MTNGHVSNSPAQSPEANANTPPAPPQTPPLPPQNEVPENPNNGSNNQNGAAQELAREFRWVEGLQLSINFVLAIIGAIALWIYSGQLEQMRISTNQTERTLILTQGQLAIASRNANIAAKALDNSEKSFVADNRPFMVGFGPSWATGLSKDSRLYANITFKNIGKTPALKQLSFARLVQFVVDRKQTNSKRAKSLRQVVVGVFDKFHEEEKMARKIIEKLPIAENDVAPGEDFWASSQDNIVLSETEFKELTESNTDPSRILFFMALVTYTDAFATPYQTEICWFFAGSNPALWHRCDVYHRIK